MIVRVLLDTCAVRNHLHQHSPLLDIPLLRSRREQYKVSIAASAYAELLEQLTERRLPFEVWAAGIQELDSVLDSKWPCFPNGNQLAFFAGTQTHIPVDEMFESHFLRACWSFLKEAKGLRDITHKKVIFRAPSGEWVTTRIDVQQLKRVTDAARQKWRDHIRNVQTIIARKGLTDKITESDIVRLMKSNLGTDPLEPADLGDKLDAPSRMIARLMHLSLKQKAPYNPDSDDRRGDAFDIDLLFAIPLPAVIVTADKKFVNRLCDTKTAHHRQLCRIEEFNEHVRNGTLHSLVGEFQTPERQFRRWQEAAYFRWEGRGKPMGDDLTDWFATEPIA